MERRESVRAVILDDVGRILLSRVTPLGASDGKDLWVTLGGRLLPHEDLTVALHRELREELAITDFEVYKRIWDADEVVNWGGRSVHLIEHFYLVRLQNVQVKFYGVDDEIGTTHELKWWDVHDISLSGHHFVPYRLDTLITDLLKSPASDCRRVKLECAD